MPTSFELAIAAIDAANRADPTHVLVRGASEPLALIHGRLADEWVSRLVPLAGETLRLAARAHHLRRWELARSTYPEGRAGYLRWRRDQKSRHAHDVAVIMIEAGYDQVLVERVQALTRRDGLGSDPETQAVEDAACLVFIETQLASVAGKLDHDKLIEVLRRTAAKMSPAALALVAEIPLGDERALLAEAFGTA